jgi:hypothetical protein
MFNRFGGQQANVINQIQDLQKKFTGNPDEAISNLLSSGKVNQNMLNQAQNMAKPIYEIMKKL